MLAQTEVLHEVTIRECAARMAYYDEMIEKEETCAVAKTKNYLQKTKNNVLLIFFWRFSF